MKIVIDLDEKYYNDIKNSPTASNYSTLYALFGIRNGTLLSEELEKIKAEIERLKPNNPNFAHYVGETRVINNALEVIDNHIKELKGE